MKHGLAWLAIGAALVAVAGLAIAAGLKLQPDKENVVASRLEGAWVSEPGLTQRLAGVKVDGEPPHGPIEFIADSAVAEKISDKMADVLKSRQVYLAGWMKQGGGKHPFVLIEHKGNPHVVWFRPRDGDPMGDSESFNVMLAVARHKANDLLFIGGDFNNQPFSAFQRAKPASQPE